MEKFSSKKLINISIAIIILLIGISIFYYFVVILPQSKQTKIGATDEAAQTLQSLKCQQFYELNKSNYWGNRPGNVMVIFNKNLNACLARYVHNDLEAEVYTEIVIQIEDMGAADDILNYYAIRGEEARKLGCKDSYVHFYKSIKTGAELLEDGCDKSYSLQEMHAQAKNLGFPAL